MNNTKIRKDASRRNKLIKELKTEVQTMEQQIEELYWVLKNRASLSKSEIDSVVKKYEK